MIPFVAIITILRGTVSLVALFEPEFEHVFSSNAILGNQNLF